MRANKGRDTTPELRVRSLLHLSGYRFRVDHPLPIDRRRRADIAFTKVGLYVFIDGCFWHGCPDHFVPPKTRAAFWLQKIESNAARDADTSARLKAVGAAVIRIWEHTDAVEAAALIGAAYQQLRRALPD